MSTGQRANQYCSLRRPVLVRFPTLYRPYLQTNMEHLFYRPKGFTIKHAPLGMLKRKEPPSPHGRRGLILRRLKLSQSDILDISSLEGKENILEARETIVCRQGSLDKELFSDTTKAISPHP